MAADCVGGIADVDVEHVAAAVVFAVVITIPPIFTLFEVARAETP